MKQPVEKLKGEQLNVEDLLMDISDKKSISQAAYENFFGVRTSSGKVYNLP